MECVLLTRVDKSTRLLVSHTALLLSFHQSLIVLLLRRPLLVPGTVYTCGAELGCSCIISHTERMIDVIHCRVM